MDKKALDAWITREPQEFGNGNDSYESEILGRTVEFWFDGFHVEPDLSEEEMLLYDDVVKEIEVMYQSDNDFGGI